jgi:hypothetical protein
MIESILVDEIQHVRFANDWLKRMTKENPRILLDVASAMRRVESIIEALSPRLGNMSLDGVELAKIKRDVAANVGDRRAAGFTDEEIAEILRKESAIASVEITTCSTAPYLPMARSAMLDSQ